MKKAGHVLRIDKLGRIVIPKQLRDAHDIHIGDTLEVFTEDDTIVLKKYAPCCVFCSSEENLVPYKGKVVCQNCLCEINAIKQ